MEKRANPTHVKASAQMSTSRVFRVLGALVIAAFLDAGQPVLAEGPAPTPASEPGIRPRPDEARRPPAPTRSPNQSANGESLRVWPLPIDSYAFTQAFGCVPQ